MDKIKNKNAKYQQIIPMEQLDFLEYYMIPESN
jgi:hypothetical protein